MTTDLLYSFEQLRCTALPGFMNQALVDPHLGFPQPLLFYPCTQIFVNLGERVWGHIPRSQCVLSKPPRRREERAGLRGATQETKGLVWVAACRVCSPGPERLEEARTKEERGGLTLACISTRNRSSLRKKTLHVLDPDHLSALVALAVAQGPVLGPPGT